MAKANGLHMIISSPCFECWVLLHFEYTTSSHDKCDDLISRLKRHMAAYEKGIPNYQDLARRTGNALCHATLVEKSQRDEARPLHLRNPGTQVHVLVDRMYRIAGAPSPAPIMEPSSKRKQAKRKGA